ncbi:MAG TPA: FeoC-like transcriptional regulator [Soehngenia sp.]|nr:FeoC-like transcriptional regulator [Soehngenia sp.]HPP31056.1 FeoC-like transcriptional regulator [Soehngenia sp.]
MLKEILKLIFEGSVKSSKDIAEKLNIDENEVNLLINQLKQMGYLEKDTGEFSCGGKCFGCNLANCPTNSIITFSLSDKGKNYIKKL